MTAKRLTHVDEKGRARMVDISDKAVTQRSATARGRVRCSAEALRRIADDSIAKGSVLDTARLAGIMGAKRTSDLIPLCHPLSLRHIDIDLQLDSSDPGIVIEATARVDGATGVEMEALTAVAIAGLTVIDMIKAVDHWATITEVALVHKEGGRSGPRSPGGCLASRGPVCSAAWIVSPEMRFSACGSAGHTASRHSATARGLPGATGRGISP